MTVLVTGATGGLAATVVKRLAGTCRDPIVETGRAARDHGDYVRCDLADRAAVVALIHRVRPRLVLHLAGSFQNDFSADVSVNALSAGWMIEATRQERLDTRFLLVGSAAEYGMVSPADNPVPESRPLRPVSVYGLTKAMQTQIAGFFAMRGAPVVVGRLFNVIGHGLSPRLFVGRAQQLIERYRCGEIASLEFGNLQSERDYLPVEDAADKLLLVARHGASGEVYNVGSGRPIRMRALLDQMLVATGCSDAPVVERPEATSERFDVPCIYADVARLEELERSVVDTAAGRRLH